MKKIISFLLVTVMFIGNCAPIFANVDNQYNSFGVETVKTEEDLYNIHEKLKNMTEAELQEMINYIAKTNTMNNVGQISRNYNVNAIHPVTGIVQLKAAWLAAAQIAKLKGYPLAATLVEHSVLHQDYSEVNGQFAQAIKNTSLYPTLIRTRSGTSEFKNGDLFYALHGFTYYSNYSSQGMRLIITDIFDFKLDSSYDNIFTSTVNNWAFLNQNMWVLDDINVWIAIDS